MGNEDRIIDNTVGTSNVDGARVKALVGYANTVETIDLAWFETPQNNRRIPTVELRVRLKRRLIRLIRHYVQLK